MPSGAGHDAAVMSKACPAAMLFVRCKDGVSHHPDESVQTADVAKALETHRDYLMNETLATAWEVGQSDARYTADKTMGDEHWTIEISL